MFRKMRRFKQQLSEEESIKILMNGSSGVLAVSGDGGYPYAVPLSYVYGDSKIYFHCAKSGHKLDAIAGNAKVSFCVVEQDQVVPEEYTSYFRSVIVFGDLRILSGDIEKRTAFALLAAKYSPEQEQGRLQEIDSQFERVCILELQIAHMTGKEAIELARRRSAVSSAVGGEV